MQICYRCAILSSEALYYYRLAQLAIKLHMGLALCGLPFLYFVLTFLRSSVTFYYDIINKYYL